jgi:type III secretory pathway component EscR
MTNEELEVLNQKRKDLEALKQFLKTSSPEQKAQVFESVKHKIEASEEQTVNELSE